MMTVQSYFHRLFVKIYIGFVNLILVSLKSGEAIT